VSGVLQNSIIFAWATNNNTENNKTTNSTVEHELTGVANNKDQLTKHPTIALAPEKSNEDDKKTEKVGVLKSKSKLKANKKKNDKRNTNHLVQSNSSSVSL
jgi:hypothetical protein